MTQTWNPTAYAASGRFVANLATAVVDLLAPQPNDHILDLGCGDGALTATLAATGALLTGVDASAPMVAAAQARAQQGLTPPRSPTTQLHLHPRAKGPPHISLGRRPRSHPKEHRSAEGATHKFAIRPESTAPPL